MSYDFSNLDFNTLKADIIAYIKESDVFTDYQFEGSALNSISNLLTYLMLQQNFYLNMTTKEMYLSSASLYRNILAISKSLNYVPHRSIGAELDIKLNFEDVVLDNGNPIIIPTNCKFDAGGFSFVTDTNYNITNSDPISIKLFQREIKTLTYSYVNELKQLDYGYEVDENFFVVKVDGTVWTQYDSSMEIDTTSEVYFIEVNYNDKLQITFGDNVFGKRPTEGSEIYIEYALTNGSLGNNLNECTLIDSVYSNSIEYTEAIITSESYSYGGLDKETAKSIKLNAPKFYESENRAVTKSDYEVILRKNIPFIDLINIWNGATEVDPIYGVVYCCVKPNTGNDLLTQTQKDFILNTIEEYMPLTLTFIIKDPLFVEVIVKSKIYYYKTYNSSVSSMESKIYDKIATYLSEDIIDDGNKLKYSSLLSVIDEVEEVSNNLTDIQLKYSFDKTVSSSSIYEFDFKNELKPGSVYSNLIQEDSSGNIINISDNKVIGNVNHSEGKVYFIKDDIPEEGSYIYFQTLINDITFDKELLPFFGGVLNTYEGI